MATGVVIQGAVEGIADEAVLRRLVNEHRATMGTVYGKGGKQQLLQRLAGFNQAARFAPWAVLIDLDTDAGCAPTALRTWLAEPADSMCFRIAVRAIESWLLADRTGIAAFLGVGHGRVPSDPDAIANPKQVMVQLANASRKRTIREDMVPRLGSGRSEGPAYSSRLDEFATNHWDPAAAALVSDSLRRCRIGIVRLITVAIL